MALFRYSALKLDGTRSEGELDAADRSDAFRRLGKLGLQPVRLEAADVAEDAPKKARRLKKKKKGKGKEGEEAVEEIVEGPIKLKRGEVILFTEELSDLLGAGLQLEPALRIMEKREDKSGIKYVAQRVRAQVRDGTSFSRSLRNASPSFGELYCSMAAAGEVSGALGKILKRQAEYLNTIQDLQGKVVFALIYPAFLILAGVAVTVLFVTFLIPQLMTLINSTGGQVPLPAKILIGLSDFFKSWWWVVLMVIVGLIVAFKAALRDEKRRYQWDKFIVTAPLVGNVLASRFYVQCMETLSTLVGNGLPLLRGIELTRDATLNLYLRDLMTQMTGIVGEGGALSRAMKKVGFFPSLLIDMVSVGEQTGDIELSLQRASERYDKELGKNIERLAALVQPVIVFIMAGVVGVMAYLMISIIFETISGLRG